MVHSESNISLDVDTCRFVRQDWSSPMKQNAFDSVFMIWALSLTVSQSQLAILEHWLNGLKSPLTPLIDW